MVFEDDTQLPDSASAEDYFALGLRLAGAGRVAEAFEALEACLQLDPNRPDACKQLARLSRAANELRAFTNWRHEALRLDPADPEPHLLLAEVLVQAGRWNEAGDEIGIALRLRSLPPELDRRARELLELTRRYAGR
ncbi:MAG: tetratricopeptide repeat protein [Bryobacteraceae bacterium]